ncbi:hypothetical protein SSS_06985 [Sarcoptes scabiei]|uniref:Uncharacterized protein n=1 Tax=Sarcoptes scabiei TaxID=52283 RepID=A0A834V833_SARSC|nr:hypothetical protein SSS_06985 [Sarcoptes scabiei]
MILSQSHNDPRMTFLPIRSNNNSNNNNKISNKSDDNNANNTSLPNLTKTSMSNQANNTGAGGDGATPNIQAATNPSSTTVTIPKLSLKTGNDGGPIILNQPGANADDSYSMNGYYACSRYFLFLVYLLLLISIILNTFIHFIFFGSNMSIGSMFIDIHHRHELIVGEYLMNDDRLSGFDPSRVHSSSYPHSKYNSNNNFNQNLYHPNHPNLHRPSESMLHCDRNSFLLLLDEFYHQYPMPKPTQTIVDNRIRLGGQSSDNNIHHTNPSNTKSYPKIFKDFARNNKEFGDDHREIGRTPSNNNNNNNQNDQNDQNDEDNIFFSSSSSSSSSSLDDHRMLSGDQSFRSSSISSPSSSSERRFYGQSNFSQSNENRLLIIEVIALIILFVLVVVQVLGLIGVIRRHLLLLIFVTIINSILFCFLVFISNLMLVSLLLLTITIGYFFIYQLKLGHKRRMKERAQFKEDLSNEIQDAIMQMRNRMSPCIHVSMEQYEAMTQQMLNRYSSPIVYCPHYNESLC